MKCTEVYQHICENLDQDMNSPRCREIKKHMSHCPDCTAYLDSLRKTVSLYRTIAPPALPKSVERELFKKIDLLVARHSSTRGRTTSSRTRQRARRD
jgi:anti-sigma factor RsiW